jgi:hypothetical protein
VSTSWRTLSIDSQLKISFIGESIGNVLAHEEGGDAGKLLPQMHSGDAASGSGVPMQPNVAKGAIAMYSKVFIKLGANSSKPDIYRAARATSPRLTLFLCWGLGLQVQLGIGGIDSS